MATEHPTHSVSVPGEMERAGEMAAGVDADSVRAELRKILASSGFNGSERASRFLRFIVEQALAGQGDQLKETLLGFEVFGRKATYDPRIDGVVRVEAVKLRARLQKYYASEGGDDPIVIDLPKGGYVPTFQNRLAPAAEPVVETATGRMRRSWRAGGGTGR